jgi:hypothetical protein
VKPARLRSDVGGFIDDPQLLGSYFTGASWDRWRSVLRAAFALPMSARDRELFHEVAERDPPTRPVKELIAVVGRGGGKDSIASGLAAYLAVTGDFTGLRPGERGTVLCVANTRDQAGIVKSYTSAYFDQVPLLRGLVEYADRDGLKLRNGAQILVGTNSLRAPRGLRIAAAIYDEVGTWRSEDGLANIDVETDAAVTPGLLRHPGSLKIMISTPYRRTGLLYDRWKKFYAHNDNDILVVVGTSLQFNPTLDAAGIDRELELDYERASAEYLCRWRDDLAAYIDRAAVEACVATGCRERGPKHGIRYVAGCDPSGGRSDAMTLAIAHKDKDGASILDVVREVKPPFSPQDVVAEFSALLKQYRITTLTGDNYAAEWNASAFRDKGIRYTVSDLDRSAIYRELLPLINAGNVSLLDNDRLVNQLCALERRIARSGKDTINHPDRGHDDLINSAAIALVRAGSAVVSLAVSKDILKRAKRRDPRFARPQLSQRVPRRGVL